MHSGSGPSRTRIDLVYWGLEDRRLEAFGGGVRSRRGEDVPRSAGLHWQEEAVGPHGPSFHVSRL